MIVEGVLVQRALSQQEVPCHVISSNESDDARVKGVRLATMHRVKGIEFDHMILAHMEAAQWRATDAPLTLENRSLIYVAATRARKSVYFTSAAELTCLEPLSSTTQYKV